MGSKNKGEDEGLFTTAESAVAFIVSLNTLWCEVEPASTCKTIKKALPTPTHQTLVLDKCAQLTGCNCSAEWPFPVPYP